MTKPTDEQLAQRREIILNRLRLGGPANAPAIAKALSENKSTVGLAMRKMVAAGELVTNGKRGRAMLFGVPGAVFPESAAPVAPRSPRSPSPKRSPPLASHRAVGLTLDDVVKKRASSRFIVRVEGVEVDCADASAVLELARAARTA